MLLLCRRELTKMLLASVGAIRLSLSGGVHGDDVEIVGSSVLCTPMTVPFE